MSAAVFCVYSFGMVVLVVCLLVHGTWDARGGV